MERGLFCILFPPGLRVTPSPPNSHSHRPRSEGQAAEDGMTLMKIEYHFPMISSARLNKPQKSDGIFNWYTSRLQLERIERTPVYASRPDLDSVQNKMRIAEATQPSLILLIFMVKSASRSCSSVDRALASGAKSCGSSPHRSTFYSKF